MGTEDRACGRHIDTMPPLQAMRRIVYWQIGRSDHWFCVMVFKLLALFRSDPFEQAIVPLLRAAQMAYDRLKDGKGKLIYVGAGTSGRLGLVDSTELWPTYNWPDERIQWVMAGERSALMHSLEGVEDNALGYLYMDKVTKDDVVIAVAASGTTPFTLDCMREAKKKGALTIGIANNPDTPLLNEADHPILLHTRPEVVAGSTRMNAGTSQTVALKSLSTMVMISLGFVYDGYMVAVAAKNEKIDKRRVNMVMDITGHSEEGARKALLEGKGDVRMAVLMLRGCTLQEAHVWLKLCNGSLRHAEVIAELERSTDLKFGGGQ